MEAPNKLFSNILAGWISLDKEIYVIETSQTFLTWCVLPFATAHWVPSTPEGFDYAKGIEETQLRNSVAIEEISLIAWHLLKHLNSRCPVSRGEVL